MKILREGLALPLLLLVLFASINSLAIHAEAPTSPGDAMIRKTMKASHISAVSAGVFSSGKQSFSSYGTSIDENSLFFIGSLSKSFTAHAILLLAEQGKLSLEDAITAHIPFFEAYFEGVNVAERITLANLLYQTSGFTNEEKRFPNAEPDMTLEDNVRNLSGRTLAFRPAEAYAYANANYNLLGYVIEQVSGRSYAAFMESEVFRPLGLESTTADKDHESGNRVEGTRTFFFQAVPYPFPVSQGTVPAGYLLSSVKDLGRWLRIHLGDIPVPPAHAAAIEKAHLPNAASVVDDRTRYAAGWFVDIEDGKIHHSGGTPNFSTRMVMDPQNNSVVCVLTNMNASANTEDMANNLMRLLQGNNDLVYRHDVWTVVDAVFSIIAVLCIVMTGLFFLVLKKSNRKATTHKRMGLAPFTLLLLVAVFLFVFPISFGSGWGKLLVWTPLSLPVGIGVVVACALLMIWGVRRTIINNTR